MKIKPGSLVLEVGSGNSPRAESTILCDRLVYDNSQRAGKFSIVIDRPFVVADGFHLPFRDKAFDYVVCSHVLEHLQDPQAFVKELTRVGKAGYIEVPSIYGERLFGWNFHLWYCQLKKGALTFSPKKEGERYGGFFHTFIAKSILFRKFCETYENTFYIKLEWKNTIKVKIAPITPHAIEQVDTDIFALLKKIDWSIMGAMPFWLGWMQKRIERKAKKLQRKFLWVLRTTFMPSSVQDQLLPLLQCIHCHKNNFFIEKSRIICMYCHTTYPLHKVIPVMLSEKEQKKGY